MTDTPQLSRAVKYALFSCDVVRMINAGGHPEERNHFTPEQLAGQYVERCAYDSGYPSTPETLELRLDLLHESGAKFDKEAALAWAVKISEWRMG